MCERANNHVVLHLTELTESSNPQIFHRYEHVLHILALFPCEIDVQTTVINHTLGSSNGMDA